MSMTPYFKIRFSYFSLFLLASQAPLLLDRLLYTPDWLQDFYVSKVSLKFVSFLLLPPKC